MAPREDQPWLRYSRYVVIRDGEAWVVKSSTYGFVEATYGPDEYTAACYYADELNKMEVEMMMEREHGQR